MSGDVLAIEQIERSELTLENLDPIEDYPKPELIEHMVEVQIEDKEGQVMKVGSLLNPGQK